WAAANPGLVLGLPHHVDHKIFATHPCWEIDFIPGSCYYVNSYVVLIWQLRPISERCEMPTQSLPAASLRPAGRLPAAGVLLRVCICLSSRGLSAIGAAISGVESGFLPALREGTQRSIATRSSPLRPGGRDGNTFGNRALVVMRTQKARSNGCGWILPPAL